MKQKFIFLLILMLLLPSASFADSDSCCLYFNRDSNITSEDFTGPDVGVNNGKVFFINGRRGYPGKKLHLDGYQFGEQKYTVAWYDDDNIIRTRPMYINRAYYDYMLDDFQILNPMTEPLSFERDTYIYSVAFEEEQEYLKYRAIDDSNLRYEIRVNGVVYYDEPVYNNFNEERYQAIPLTPGENIIWVKSYYDNTQAFYYKFIVKNGNEATRPAPSEQVTTGPATQFKSIEIAGSNSLTTTGPATWINYKNYVLTQPTPSLNLNLEGFSGQGYETWNNGVLVEKGLMAEDQITHTVIPLNLEWNSIEIKSVINNQTTATYRCTIDNRNNGSYLEGITLFNTGKFIEPSTFNPFVKDYTVRSMAYKSQGDPRAEFDFTLTTSGSGTTFYLNNTVINNPSEFQFNPVSGGSGFMTIGLEANNKLTNYKFNVNGAYEAKPQIQTYTLNDANWLFPQDSWRMPIDHYSITFKANVDNDSQFIINGRAYNSGTFSERFLRPETECVLPVDVINQETHFESSYDIYIKPEASDWDINYKFITPDGVETNFNMWDVDVTYQMVTDTNEQTLLVVDRVPPGFDFLVNGEVQRSNTFYFTNDIEDDAIVIELIKDNFSRAYVINLIK